MKKRSRYSLHGRAQEFVDGPSREWAKAERERREPHGWFPKAVREQHAREAAG